MGLKVFLYFWQKFLLLKKKKKSDSDEFVWLCNTVCISLLVLQVCEAVSN